MVVESLFSSLIASWEVTTLGEACIRSGGNIQTGPFGSQLHASDYVPFGIPSIMPQNIGDNRVFTEGIARITPEDAARLSRYLVQTGDIVYSRRGDVERRALIRAEEDGWLCGTGCLRVRFGNSEVDPFYASYYLGHPSVRGWIVRHAVGATMPNLNTSILSALPFVIPPLPEQKAIAHILGTLDDKIELNREMNQTLEAMARAIFKSWFVDFDPVRAKMEGRQPAGMDAATAELFPDEFEESALGIIPKGWKQVSLGDVLKIYDSKRIPLSSRERAQRQGNYPYYGAASVMDYVDDYLFEGVYVLMGEDGSVIDDDDHPILQYVWGKFWVNNHAHVLQGANDISSEHLMLFLKQTNIRPYVTGAVQPKLNQGNLFRIPFLLPSSQISVVFGSELSRFYALFRSNCEQSRSLASIRDTLLPKLLSGEIRVKEAEKIAAKAM
ncbi:restriction endonuclease subunit S [Nostoc sp. CALU 546]|uniref:restriction endonuclease subunit S n=1 Tax=Nostoc sp. CALU 546 TaxID=1867241 RepID=UPI003B671ED6